jgi:membrane peptidoglycan carboxypeptidase
MISSEERTAGLLAVQNYEFNDYIASLKAPHFVFYVKELLERKYGREMVENGGLRVQTTLDYNLYEESLKQVRAQAQINRNNFNARNAAAITVNPQTGEVLSMVGSANYHDVEIDGSVNMTTASRQPGSAFKPIVYAGAFLRNAGAGTIMYDVPTRLDQDTPRNYDGTFRGPMSIRTALAQSRNIPAVKAYFMAGEQDGIIALSESMGISTLDRKIDYGWPLALGSGEVRMIDMAEAFGVFANGGDRVQVNAIMKVTDNRGRVLEDNTRTQSRRFRVLDPGAAYIINHILSDRSINLSQQMNLPDSRVSAMKTGTSTKRVGDTSFPSNLWAVGYTPQLITVVWAGNSNGDEMRLGADGTNGAVPIWNRIMSFALRNAPQVNFERPENVVSTSVSRLSGKLPGANTPPSLVFSDLFTTTTIPREADNSFFRQAVDIRNNKRPNQFCPPEMVQEVTFYNPQSEVPGPRFNWRQEIIDWFEGLEPEQLAELNLGENVVLGMPIDEDSELCNPDLANKFLDVNILEPAENSVIARGLFTVEAAAEAESGIERVEFYFNNDLAETVTSQPWRADLRIPVGFRPGREFRVRVKVTDRNGFSRERAINLITGESEAESLEWELMEDVPAESAGA